MKNKRRIYVCFDEYNDFHYYRMMQTWKRTHDTDFRFYHGQSLNNLSGQNQDETIKKKIKNQMQQAQAFVVLIGESTRYLHQFVQWEIEQALARDLPIIGVNLNGLRFQDIDRCPPSITDKLAVHISFNAVILQHTLNTWPEVHTRLREEGKSGPYYYKESFYSELGL